jgi:hypothetical protein
LPLDRLGIFYGLLSYREYDDHLLESLIYREHASARRWWFTASPEQVHQLEMHEPPGP